MLQKRTLSFKAPGLDLSINKTKHRLSLNPGFSITKASWTKLIEGDRNSLYIG
ncbi:MAG TPA: hypothetical protein V6D43_10345 [Candidatus Sericytochromatia bacterium]